MKRAVTVFTLVVLAAVSLLVVPGQATAGSSTDAALALGAFAVFNQIVRGETIFNGVHRAPQPAVVYAPPPPPPTVVYAPAPPPPVVYAPAPPPPPVVYAPAPPPVVVYPSNGYYYGYYYPAYRHAPPAYGYVTPGYYRVYGRQW